MTLAAPVSTTLRIVDSGPSASFISIGLEALGGLITSDITTFISGEFHVTMDNVGVQTLSLTIDNASLALSDVNVNIDLGFLGGVAGELTGTTLSMSGVPHAQLPHSAGMTSFFDLGGDTISIDSGLLTYEGTGSIGGVLGSGTLDLAVSPLGFELPSGATIRILESAVSPTKNNVTLLVPLSIPSTTLVTDPIDVSASLTALLIATGMTIVPEPGSLVLLGIGVVGLLTVLARRR